MFCRSAQRLQSLRKLSQNFVSHFSHILSRDGKWPREGHFWDKILACEFWVSSQSWAGWGLITDSTVHNDVKSRLRYLPNTPKQTTEDTHVTQNLRHHLLLSTDVPQTLDTINTSSVTTHFLFSYMDFTHLIFNYLHDLLSTLHHFC
jgi:hypothetical protein